MNPEPYRIKVVERIAPTTRAERRKILRAAGFNPFLIPADKVYIDLVSDSGTSALSSEQWSAMVAADESFAMQSGYDRFVDTVRELTALPFVFPVHQARAAEHIVFTHLVKKGTTGCANAFFETTRENIEFLGGRTEDLPGSDPVYPGNISIERLTRALKAKKNGFVLMTITSNRDGGQPVSRDNIRRVKTLARRHNLPVIIDGCRFAENAYLVKERTPSLRNRSVRSIARDIFSLADIVYVSAKKDGLSNTGGFIAVRDAKLADTIRDFIMLFEGFFSHGGLAGRDLAAVCQGLNEALDEGYLRFRIDQVRFLADALDKAGVNVKKPVGGHAVCIDPEPFAPVINHYPGFALANAVYEYGSVRGGVFGAFPGERQTFRLAVPRRVYTDSQLEYAARTVAACRNVPLVPLRLINRSRRLPNFTARFTPLANSR